MGTFGGFGQIPHAKVTPQLHRIEVGSKTGHDDSSFKRTCGGRFLPAWVHLSEAVGLTRRSASRRPTPGREARKSPCQQISHEYQASVPRDRKANEIAGAGCVPSTRGGLSTPLTYHRRTEQHVRVRHGRPFRPAESG